MVLLTSVSVTTFKDLKYRNYFSKKSNTTNFDTLNTHIFMKTYDLKSLISVPKTLVSISHTFKSLSGE